MGPSVRFLAGAIYFFIIHMRPSASDILFVVVNGPNTSFQVFFKPTQHRNTIFGDFCFKLWLERRALNIFLKTNEQVYSTSKCDPNALGFKQFAGVFEGGVAETKYVLDQMSEMSGLDARKDLSPIPLGGPPGCHSTAATHA